MRAASFNAAVSSAPFPSTALLWDLNGSERVNVLMVGYGGGDHDGPYLADSIQILSIDPATDTTTTIPIPRDLWIEGVAAFAQNGKVNEVFSVGHGAVEGDEAARLDNAGDLMAEALSEVTGLEIDHWLAIDFTGFQEMVDAVGGVTVNNPVAFDYTTIEQFHRAGPMGDGRLRGRRDPARRRAGARLRPRPLHERRRRVERLRAVGPPGPHPRRASHQARRGRHRRDPSRACA